jgi:hypothetical protein
MCINMLHSCTDVATKLVEAQGCPGFWPRQRRLGPWGTIAGVGCNEASSLRTVIVDVFWNGVVMAHSCSILISDTSLFNYVGHKVRNTLLLNLSNLCQYLHASVTSWLQCSDCVPPSELQQSILILAVNDSDCMWSVSATEVFHARLNSFSFAS